MFDVTEPVIFGQPNIIAGRVDNSHNPDIPPLNADFTFYGGIYHQSSPGLFTNLDLAVQFGQFQAVERRVRVQATNGQSISVRFKLQIGSPVVSTIRIDKTH